MSQGDHPYRAQPAKAFWRQAVEQRHCLEISDWYRRKWPITGSRIATAGSCFAQHIGRRLRRNGFDFVDVEPPPDCLSPSRHLDFGYGMYSARFGNIYTTRQLLQLLQRALGEFEPEDSAWRKGGGWVDPLRPTIEPEPLGSVDEVDALRQAHLSAVRRMFETCDVFVFTLGLTEAWLSGVDGTAYPVCPGTHGGEFDASRHAFVNLDYAQVLADLEAFVARALQLNGRMRFLFTVSPVPLVATATNHHVVPASTYSKSVLRAVAGYLADRHECIDYFPSYEIVSSPVMRGSFFNPDQRTVVEAGVEHVMGHFFREHPPPAAVAAAAATPADAGDADDVVCDEELLATFGATR